MRPILACAVAIAALIWMPASWALGLGDVELRSALNQPLDARIELVSPRQEELDQLQVGLASTEHFQRYGLERTAIHARMRFELVRDGRDAYIHVTTEQPVRDPFVSFLVEARWAAGRLLREYTLLLDPPDFGPGEAAEPERAVTEAEPREPRPEPRAERPRPEPEPERVTPRRTEIDRAAPRLGGRFGPVQRNQNLWNIANELRPSGVSINQMMIALFEANPGAFDGNINRLRQGAVLRVPERAELDRVNVSVANREVTRQNEAWQQGRARVAEAPQREQRDELRLVAPGEEDAEAVGVGTEEAETRIAELETQLDRARDQRAEAEDQSAGLRDRVSELEGEIDELRRMLELKDEQLASLQQRVRDDDLVAGLEEEPVFVDEEDMLPEEDDELIRDEDEDAALADEDDDALAALDDEAAAEDMAALEEEPVTEAEEPARPATRHQEPPSMLSRITGLLATPVGMGILGALVLAAALGLVAVRRRRAATTASVTEWDEGDDGDLADAEVSPDGSDVEDVNLSDDLDAAEAREEAAPADCGTNVEELLEEADFHVAYGTYDKASGMLEDALANNARDARIHLKLAETHFAAGNAAAFVEAARRFRNEMGDDSDEWAQIARMGREIAPSEDMFAGAAPDEAGTDDLEPPEGGTLSDGMLHADDMSEAIDLDLDADVTADDGEDEPVFDLPDDSAGDEGGVSGRSDELVDSDAGGGDDDLSFDLPDLDEGDGSGPSQAEPESPAPAAEEPSDSDDLDFGLDEESASVLDRTAEGDTDKDEDLDFPTVDVPPEKANEAFGTDSQAQFEKAFQELSAYVGSDEDKGGDAGEMSWQRDEPGTTTADEGRPGGIDFGDDDDELLDLGDDDGDEMGEIDTKIDLARAYIDMGDSDGARGILEEVIDEGNEDQQKEARSLLESI
ncbi:FimV/HubP family polar landmark protein [Natronospira bacteriovora]|uniref:FimV/HubP family polar landmark protein n=1 Tax=Natronospira bacteriovora TaxID=3069753 RepID=A0ABU0W4G8_9GAMM|nr:FimV/HubP family polar landmark protein [Natronospira sp. AB-CW4]MDQ2068921.1 FimV/HubP family polar landmark protein [Natronospira sp. AB-CW4]